jgi:hypothetical protein
VPAEQQQVLRLRTEYTNLHIASGLLLRCYDVLTSKWPGKLLAGNTIAACFKPAVQLMWEVMEFDAAMTNHANIRAAISGSSDDARGPYPTDAVALTAWIYDNARRVSIELSRQEMSHGPDSMPQQSVELLAEPTLYEQLGVALGGLVLVLLVSRL